MSMYICHVRRRMQGLIFFRFLRIKTLNPASFVSNKNYLTPWTNYKAHGEFQSMQNVFSII